MLRGQVGAVVNFELPSDVPAYTHRIGTQNHTLPRGRGKAGRGFHIALSDRCGLGCGRGALHRTPPPCERWLLVVLCSGAAA